MLSLRGAAATKQSRCNPTRLLRLWPRNDSLEINNLFEREMTVSAH